MGRRKYSYKGKPHGRNELIKEYLWIAYLQTLALGQRPDPNMARTRKQVSSHIQVLKGFLRDHPACKDLPYFVRELVLTSLSLSTVS
jgi:transcriptional enhancer factor